MNTATIERPLKTALQRATGNPPLRSAVELVAGAATFENDPEFSAGVIPGPTDADVEHVRQHLLPGATRTDALKHMGFALKNEHPVSDEIARLNAEAAELTARAQQAEYVAAKSETDLRNSLQAIGLARRELAGLEDQLNAATTPWHPELRTLVISEFLGSTRGDHYCLARYDLYAKAHAQQAMVRDLFPAEIAARKAELEKLIASAREIAKTHKLDLQAAAEKAGVTL